MMSQDTCHIILDAARMDAELEKAKELNPGFESLYRGYKEAYLSSVAPYIFPFPTNSEFCSWYFQSGWGNSWGVLVYSNKELASLVKHFRQFLMVQTEEKEELYFRFYDPRVLRIFLPTCDQQQLKEFFGPVDYFICEDKDPDSGLLFSLENGNLKLEKITKEQVISFEPEEKKRKRLFF
jgi:hypothetical protein